MVMYIGLNANMQKVTERITLWVGYTVLVLSECLLKVKKSHKNTLSTFTDTWPNSPNKLTAMTPNMAT